MSVDIEMSTQEEVAQNLRKLLEVVEAGVTKATIDSFEQQLEQQLGTKLTAIFTLVATTISKAMLVAITAGINPNMVIAQLVLVMAQTDESVNQQLQELGLGD